MSSVRTLLHQVSLLSFLHQFRRQFLELLLPTLTGIVPSPVLHSPLTAPSWYHGLRFSHDARRSPCLSLPLNLMPMGISPGPPFPSNSRDSALGFWWWIWQPSLANSTTKTLRTAGGSEQPERRLRN